MRKKSGFSLMEMMIVLLITAVVAAATAPIISKKMVAGAGGDSPWLWAGTDHSIVYNVGGGTRQTANIGDIYTKNDNKPRLYIATNSHKIPQIAFKGSGDTIMKLLASNDSIVFSNNISSAPQSGSVAIGAGTNADSQNTTSIGYNATASSNAVALGYKATAGDDSIAIGYNKTAGTNALALGGDANASNATAVGIGSNAGTNSLAIGASANASGTDALAIGYGAQAMKDGSVGITMGGDAYGAKGKESTAYGYKALANEDSSVALGSNVTANLRSVVVGHESSATGINSVAYLKKSFP